MSSQYNGQNVKMYKGVPFGPDYTHTLAAGIGGKTSWLDSNCSPTEYTNLMHIKLDTTTGKGTIRLEVPDSEATLYNYCRVESKSPVYFCFVLGCRYINDGKTAGSSVYEFDIEKDVMASCLNNIAELTECAIDRHHSGPNKFNNPWVPEPFMGTALNKDYERLNFETGECYCVIQYYLAQPNAFDQPGLIGSRGDFASRVPCGTSGVFFKVYDYAALGNVLHDDVKMGACVSAIYVAPKCLFTAAPADGGGYFTDTVTRKDALTVSVTPYSGVPGTVENNKCYYYPYNYYKVYNDRGESIDLKYELWDDGHTAYGDSRLLALEGVAIPPVEVCLSPVGYAGASPNIWHGSGSEFAGNYYAQMSSHKLKMGDYPIGSWVNDTYAAAVGKYRGGQTFVKGASKAISSLLGGSADGAIKGALGAVTGDYLSVAGSYWEPDTLQGSYDAGGAEYVGMHKYFYGSHMALSDEDFKRLDSLFTRYGYAQGGLVAKPDPAARENWTYIKTIGDPFEATSDNHANASEVLKVNAIFKAGITFWSTGIPARDIGDYSRGNGTDSLPLP